MFGIIWICGKVTISTARFPRASVTCGPDFGYIHGSHAVLVGWWCSRVVRVANAPVAQLV